jgi:DNA helicase HerA-like ATPase
MSNASLNVAMVGDGRALRLPLRLANRHGLVTGATGTGKTVTLQRLAECFSAAGIPVFAADIKGDLSGIAKAGAVDSRAADRAARMGRKYTPTACPVRMWDVWGTNGAPIRTSLHEMGVQTLARMLELNDVQEGVLQIAFTRTRDEGLYIRDMRDLKYVVADLMDHVEDIRLEYGNVTVATVGAIQRAILKLEAQGGDKIFAEPAFDVNTLLEVAANGMGYVNLLDATSLVEMPRVYSILMLWILEALFAALPEAGDLDKPKLVFFFDEAHLLFKKAPKRLLEAIERTVRLIRSKGVGVYFVTQSPADVPDSVLAQLGNRLQHALRAYTPRDRRAVKAAADAFRPNPLLDTAEAISNLGVGEALVSLLQSDGTPAVVDRAWVIPPGSQIGPIADDEKDAIIAGDAVTQKYLATLSEEEAHRSFMLRVDPEWVQERDAEAAAEAVAEAEAAAQHNTSPLVPPWLAFVLTAIASLFAHYLAGKG